MWNDQKCIFEISLETCGPNPPLCYFCPHLGRHLSTHIPMSTNTLHKIWLWTLHAFSQRNRCLFPERERELLWASSQHVRVRVAPAFLAKAAQRSMRLSKHSMAAGACSQDWGREEGMRLRGNKSKFLWNDLTGNDRVSALYNHTARERERAGEVLPKHRVVPDLGRWGWWNNKAFPVCVFH